MSNLEVFANGSVKKIFDLSKTRALRFSCENFLFSRITCPSQILDWQLELFTFFDSCQNTMWFCDINEITATVSKILTF